MPRSPVVTRFGSRQAAQEDEGQADDGEGGSTPPPPVTRRRLESVLISLAEQQVKSSKEKEDIDPLVALILERLELKSIPQPMDLSTEVLVTEPLLWFILFETMDITPLDYRSRFGVRGNFAQAFMEQLRTIFPLATDVELNIVVDYSNSIFSLYHGSSCDTAEALLGLCDSLLRGATTAITNMRVAKFSALNPTVGKKYQELRGPLDGSVLPPKDRAALERALTLSKGSNQDKGGHAKPQGGKCNHCLEHFKGNIRTHLRQCQKFRDMKKR
jgi:hypothetical protein